jgi:hypothetical protein
MSLMATAKDPMNEDRLWRVPSKVVDTATRTTGARLMNDRPLSRFLNTLVTTSSASHSIQPVQVFRLTTLKSTIIKVHFTRRPFETSAGRQNARERFEPVERDS